MNMDKLIEDAQELLFVFGAKLLSALIILIIGRWVAKLVSSLVRKLMGKSKVDVTITSFTSNLTYVALMAFVVLAALGKLGVQTTSFVALIGAAGLAVSLAFQGTLSNFASGVLIIIFKPFKVGDFIEGAGASGTVEEIVIFTTRLKTPDNKVVIIPNSKLFESNIINYSQRETRRVDLVFGVSYEDDIDKVKAVFNTENPTNTILDLAWVPA